MRRIARSFLISGAVGICAAVAVYAFGSVSVLRTKLFIDYLMLALAPASILGLAEPGTVGDKMLLLGIVFGTNFALYDLRQQKYPHRNLLGKIKPPIRLPGEGS